MSATVITILVLSGLILIMLFLFYIQHKKLKEVKEKLNVEIQAYDGLFREFELYRKAEQFNHKQEEKVNEKIDDLHSGKLSADDVLPKR